MPYEKIGDKEQCIAELIPFEIPNSWEWVRLGNVSTYSQPKKKIKLNSVDQKIWGLELEDIAKGGKILSKKSVGDRNSTGDKTIFDRGDILYSKLRPYLLKILVSDEAGICTSEIVPFKCYGNIISEYIVFYLKSPYIDNCINQLTYGTKMPRVGTETMTNLLIPLPPLEEQKRIVEKLEKLLPLVDEYEENYNELEKLDSEFPDKFKKSILQYAIQGKLVKQDQNDEPASVLLEKIKAEKQELIKAGKIKKDKNEAVIYRKTSTTQHDVSYENINKGGFASNEKNQNEGSVDFYEKFANGEEKCINDELPFEIPSSWEWVKLGNVANIYTGNSISEIEKKEKYLNSFGFYKYIATKDINFNNEINYDNGVSIPKEETKFRYAYKDSVLMCLEGGSAGKKIGFLDRQVCFGNKLATFNSLGINPLYVFFYLQSPIFINFFNSLIVGIIGGVSLSNLKSILIPLPPLAEQKRIVAKIEELFKIIEPLTENK